MITYEHLVGLWGEANVVRADPARVAALRLPLKTTHALVEIGLPRHVERCFEVVSPTLVEAPHRPGRYCHIGDEALRWSTAQFWVDAETGAILYVDPDTKAPERMPDRFANTTLPLFIQSLYLDARARGRWSGLSERAIIARAGELRETLRRLDPLAFEDPDSYWPTVFEDIWE
jgi:hypothetical protein